MFIFSNVPVAKKTLKATLAIAKFCIPLQIALLHARNFTHTSHKTWSLITSIHFARQVLDVLFFSPGNHKASTLLPSQITSLQLSGEEKKKKVKKKKNTRASVKRAARQFTSVGWWVRKKKGKSQRELSTWLPP